MVGGSPSPPSTGQKLPSVQGAVFPLMLSEEGACGLLPAPWLLKNVQDHFLWAVGCL